MLAGMRSLPLTSLSMKYHRLSRVARILAGLAVAALAIGSLANAGASPISFEEDGTPGANWSTMRYSGTAPLQAATLHGKTWLLITRSSEFNNTSQVTYNGGHIDKNGNPVIHADNQFGDLSGKIIIGASHWDTYAGPSVLLRSGAAHFKTTTAYHVIVNANGLGLYWGVKDDLGLPTPLALAPLPSGFRSGSKRL